MVSSTIQLRAPFLPPSVPHIPPSLPHIPTYLCLYACRCMYMFDCYKYSTYYVPPTATSRCLPIRAHSTCFMIYGTTSLAGKINVAGLLVAKIKSALHALPLPSPLLRALTPFWHLKLLCLEKALMKLVSQS